MLTTDLWERSTGESSPFAFAQKQTTRLLHALQPAPDILFDGQGDQSREPLNESTSSTNAADQDASNTGQSLRIAHKSGVNALAIDKFEGRYLISGAANGNISLWDLEKSSENIGDGRGHLVHVPDGSVAKSSKAQSFGITGLSFYPFDSFAFLASSYDHTIKIYDSVQLEVSATFNLESVVYSHATSPIAQHLLIACATQRPVVRLADMRSGSTTHSLLGHTGGAVLSVAWSPKNENILASGGNDGTVHVWDIRRSASSLGVFDMEDGIGIAEQNGLDKFVRQRGQGQAHAGPVNGITWTDDGKYLASTGHDERVRVWDVSVGANTLVNFGPIIRNSDIATLTPLIAPQVLTLRSMDVLFFPNGREILMCELFEGRLLKRLKVHSLRSTVQGQESVGQRNVGNRVLALAWRAHQIELLSAHSDGTIRCWQPRTSIDAHVDEAGTSEDGNGPEEDVRKRKRQTMDEIYREMTKSRVTFT